MDRNSPEPTLNSKTLLTVLQFILPVILAIVAGYGSVKYSFGETQQKLLEIERRVQTNAEGINKLDSKAVTREELKQFIEATRSDLVEIKIDIRALRAK